MKSAVQLENLYPLVSRSFWGRHVLNRKASNRSIDLGKVQLLHTPICGNVVCQFSNFASRSTLSDPQHGIIGRKFITPERYPGEPPSCLSIAHNQSIRGQELFPTP
jgi:hypothetical protein